MTKVFSVSSAQELMNALAIAKGGDTVELAGGDYGKLDLQSAKTFGVKAIYDSAVTIVSANPEERASFSGMDLRGVENLTFDNVVFDSDFTGAAAWVAPFTIQHSTGITIRNSLFQGELASGTGDPTIDGFATGKGLTVEHSFDITIENNEFSTWHRGMTVGGSQNVMVIGNDIHSIRSDGMNFAHVQNVLIEDNYIHDFVRSTTSGDHADMIQFWTNGGTNPSTDIVIRGNTLDVGSGEETQSIFMRNDMVDRSLAGEEMFYRDILIEENVILNNQTHGITIGETDGLIIRRNSVLDADSQVSASVATPKINVAPLSKDVVIERNATADISGYSNQLDWIVKNNAFVQNSNKEHLGFYEREFIYSSMGGEAASFIVDPTGIIARMDAGASRLRLDSSHNELIPVFDVSNAKGAENSIILDAGYTFTPDGQDMSGSTRYLWDFGDGASAIGQVVRHTYSDAGHYDVTLTVVAQDGAMAKASSSVSIIGDDLLSYNPKTGYFGSKAYGMTTDILDSNTASSGDRSGYAIDIGAQDVSLVVDKSEMGRFFGAESFEIMLSLRANEFGSTGEIASSDSNFMLSVAEQGGVGFKLWTDTQFVNLVTTGAVINDGADHNIRISFDSGTSSLAIYIDEHLAGEAEVLGAMRSDFPRSLVFGNGWGKQVFDGTLTAFNLEVDSDVFPDYEGNLSSIPHSSSVNNEFPAEDIKVDPDTISEPTAPDVSEEDPLEPAIPESLIDEGHSDEYDDHSEMPKHGLPILPEVPLYKLDLAEIGKGNGKVNLKGDAYLVEGTDSKNLVFDGEGDSAIIGRVEALEQSQQFNATFNFQRSNVDSGNERLVWNHSKFGVSIESDALIVYVANKDTPFHKGFVVSNAGVGDTDRHSLNVAVDAKADRLQVVLDGKIVLDEQETDFDIVGAGGNEWGWSIGAAWGRHYEGSMSGFELDDQAFFFDDAVLLG